MYIYDINLRFNIVISLSRRYDGKEWIRQRQPWLSRLSLPPHLMKALSTDASTQMGMQLSRLAQDISTNFGLVEGFDKRNFFMRSFGKHGHKFEDDDAWREKTATIGAILTSIFGRRRVKSASTGLVQSIDGRLSC